ncbi:MAG TPA: hypothetical protein VJR29_13030 [bacterium]|nr:hypothetical protein [bacterium]
MKNAWQRLFCALALSISLILSACGSGGQPFLMDVQSDLIVTATNPDSLVIQTAVGTLEAEIVQEFNDRFELDVFNLNASATFPDLGPINLVLDPNFPASATVYKLNRNNNPSGTNTMRLSLIIETPEQNLTLSDLTLSSNSASLQLDQDLPPLTFFFQGQPMQIDLSTLQVQIPASLIVSFFDPQ